MISVNLLVIETDACQKGIGTVLMQGKRPLAYLSKSIGVRNMGMSIYEMELLALMTAVGKWRHYLEGHHFIIKIDHRSLKYLLEQRITAPLQQMWLTKLLGLSYEIVYKRRIDNRNFNCHTCMASRSYRKLQRE